MPLWVLAAPTILIYGDSLSAAYGIPRDKGWTELLQLRLAEKGYSHRVANASISGETTSGGLSRIDDTLKQTRPEVVILELGANDGLRGLPVDEMQRNLAAMIEACQRHDAKVLLLGMRIPPNYGPRYTREFAASYKSLAKQYQVPILEFFLDGVAGKRLLTQEDGLHPTEAAQKRLLENVWSVLPKVLGKPVKTVPKR